MILDDITPADITALKQRILARPYRTYKELNVIEQLLVANGCGGKSSIIKPPNFVFGCACNEHDSKYYYGGNKERRKFSDKEFYKQMKQSIKESDASYLRKFHYKIWAWIYYIEVRRHGAGFFNFRQGARF